MAVKKLEWDSEFFGFEIGELNFGQTCDNTDIYQLLYVKNSNDFDMEISGFISTHSENKLVFRKSLNHTDDNVTATEITDSLGEVPIDALYQLAYESGKYSRFNIDKNFVESDFKRLYRQWVDNSLNYKFADGFLFYIDQGSLCGFVTYKISPGFATIGLIAVSPDMQGRGIGRQLLMSVENLLILKGIYELRIPTQGDNVSACNFYTKMKYDVFESTVIKHYWNKNLKVNKNE